MKASQKLNNQLSNHGALSVPACNAGGYVYCDDNMADFNFGITSANRSASGARTGTGYFTIEFWMKPTVTDSSSTGHNFSGSLGLGFGDTGLTNTNGRIGMYLDRNRPTFQTSGFTNNTYNNPDAYGASNRTLAVNTWYHIAFVCDGTNTAVNNRLYVNGYLYNNSYYNPWNGSAAYGQPTQISIGGYWVGNTACDWDDFRVYKGVALYGEPTDTVTSNGAVGTSAGGTLASNYTLPTRNAPPPASGYESYMVLDYGGNRVQNDRTGRHTFKPMTAAYGLSKFGTNYAYTTTASAVNVSNQITLGSSTNVSGGLSFYLSANLGNLVAGQVYYFSTTGTTPTVWQYRDGTPVTTGTASGSVTVYFGYYLPQFDVSKFTAERF